ncbi:hypothetical protein [Bordetella sp. LUAb4]|uniref:hypothetical protein n=1 Tax=Bordetella sp. LUAb4 TaxID=2843195 RepID=UPI001E52E5A4|nr:hypothetical protein [Bordetella sp. LUAb4]
MKRICLAVAALAVAAGLNGCMSIRAQPYAATPESASVLKDAGVATVDVGTFDASPASLAKPVSMPGPVTLRSPFGDSYASYLGEALRQELEQAGKYAKGSDTVVTGTLTKNEVHANLFSRGKGQLEARFVVTRAGQVVYDQVKSVDHSWNSAPIGAIAIESAGANYPRMVQKLIASLFSDPAFVAALK